jgi:hypothetical protein
MAKSDFISVSINAVPNLSSCRQDGPIADVDTIERAIDMSLGPPNLIYVSDEVQIVRRGKGLARQSKQVLRLR